MSNDQHTTGTHYRIAGSIVAPDSRRLAEALALPDLQTRDKGGEVVLRAPGFSASIYDSGIARPTGAEFLVSSSFRGDMASLRERLDAIAGALRTHGLSFEVEVQDESGAEVMVLRDDATSGQTAGGQRTLTVTFNASGAPDSPYGRERLALRDDGQLRYERWFAADHAERTVRAAASATHELFAALEDSTFPSVTKHNIPPGASLVEIVLAEAGSIRSTSLDLYKGLTFPGYGDVLRRMADWAKALRQLEVAPPPDLGPWEDP